ncbi:MAG: class II aldolase [Rhodospirillaceae bacterium]|nr:class II aldolase [Rhodospirillaceae bacterium]|tara:strand:- start:1492 stop:2166 length:675 start_codon:yes stop_codon:yes gene_type:complete
MVKRKKFIQNSRSIVDAAKFLGNNNINGPKSGNISVRKGLGFLITPSGIDYESITAKEILNLDQKGNVTKLTDIQPSSEWRIHRDVYIARPEINAIVHTHSVKATALSCLGIEIPSFHYMVAIAGGNNVRCARYATFGTQRLSKYALKALENRYACLLSNHGVIALGKSLENAVDLAIEIELLAAQYLSALTIANPNILSKKEMEKIVKRFKFYKEGKSLPNEE